MNKLRDWLENFMYGRYGMDPLGNFTLWTAVALMLLGLLTRVSLLNSLALLLLFWGYFRMFSRNRAKRLAENDKYMELKDRVMGFFKGNRTTRDKEHAYFTCPHCRQKVRVPRGKGMIEIRCPKCGTTFRKRT